MIKHTLKSAYELKKKFCAATNSKTSDFEFALFNAMLLCCSKFMHEQHITEIDEDEALTLLEFHVSDTEYDNVLDMLVSMYYQKNPIL